MDSLPLSKDLLEFYRDRLESYQQEYKNLLLNIDKIQLDHETQHKTEWQLHKANSEIAQMLKHQSNAQIAVFDQRKQMLKLMAENDFLKLNELKDRKKIRYLLNCTRTDELETTYFKENIPKSSVNLRASRAEPSIDLQKRDIPSLDDEIESLKLEVFSTKTQLEEQRIAFEDIISNLKKDRSIKDQEDSIRAEHDSLKIQDLLKQIERLRNLSRENTRELLTCKKEFQKRERILIEEKHAFTKNREELQENLIEQQDRVINAERNIEQKVTRKQETLLTDLRSQLGSYEQEISILQNQYNEMDTRHKKRATQLQQRAQQIAQSYLTLRRRRDHEIEGFTNDIIMLRKSIKSLEKCILKFGVLEDRELVLLGIAQRTGLKADQIGRELSGLKGRVYGVEDKLVALTH